MKNPTITTSKIAYKPAGQFEDTRFEKIHNVVFSNSEEGSICVAQEIAALIRSKQAKDKPCILG
jgi:glucosamine-6-phosphate deaminase